MHTYKHSSGCTTLQILTDRLWDSLYSFYFIVLQLTQGISGQVVGPQRRTLITLDLDLYARTLKIQQSVGNIPAAWILRAGALHISFAALYALAKQSVEVTLTPCTIESSAYTSAALCGIFSGKAYKRGIEHPITTCLAILMINFDFIVSKLPKEEIQVESSALKDKLQEHKPEMVKIFKDIRLWYAGNVKPQENDKEIGEFAQFMTEYLHKVEVFYILLALVVRLVGRDTWHYKKTS